MHRVYGEWGVAVMSVARLVRRHVRSSGVVMAAAVASVAWACSRDERVSSTREAVILPGIPGTDAGIGQTAAARDEPQGVWSFGPAIAGQTEILDIAANPPMVWAFSVNGGAIFADCSLFANCNGGPFDAGVGTKPLGNPVLVTDGRGHVVYVNLLDTTNDPCPQCNAEKILLAVSIDGGKTYPSDHLAIANDKQCGDGIQDQPHAAFDMTTDPPALWVGWLHKQNSLAANGTCVRRFFLDPKNAFRVTPLGDAVVVGGMSEQRALTGNGSIRVQAGDGAVTVMYNNHYIQNCDTTNPSKDESSLAYETVTSFDNGRTWSQRSRLLTTNHFRSCVLDKKGKQKPTIDVFGRSFDFVRAPDGTYYAIVQDNKDTARLYQGRITYGLGDSLWREFCPDTPQSPVLPTKASWTAPGVACPTARFRAPPNGSIAWPTIGADDRSRVLFWYYESNATDTLLHVKAFANVAPRDPATSWQSAILTPDFQPADPKRTPIATRALGDYAGLAVRGAFGGGTALPQCGDAGTFYPVWIFAHDPGDGGVAIPGRAQTTRVEVTP